MADGGGGRTGGASLTVNNVKMMIAPEDIQATAQRLRGVAKDLQHVLSQAGAEFAAPAPGLDPASTFASLNVRMSMVSATKSVTAAITQLELAADNLESNGQQYVAADQL